MDAASDPDLDLMLAYAKPGARVPLATLFALDRRLGQSVARAREPAIGLMRLIWWRDALDALDTGPAPAEPLLGACAGLSMVRGAELAAMTGGWEALLDDPGLSAETVALYARERGGRLFTLAARLLAPGADPPMPEAGAGWALYDFGRHTTEAEASATARAAAEPLLAAALCRRWPRALRPLGQLVALAAYDLAGRPPGRGRTLRVLRHQLTGR